jgi:hypothetical protein
MNQIAATLRGAWSRLVAIQFTKLHRCRKGLESKAPSLLLLPILFTTKILLTAQASTLSTNNTPTGTITIIQLKKLKKDITVHAQHVLSSISTPFHSFITQKGKYRSCMIKAVHSLSVDRGIICRIKGKT